MRYWRAVIFILWGLVVLPSMGKSEGISIDYLSRVQAISVEMSLPPRLYVATQQGLFMVTADGIAIDVSQLDIDMMGFVVDPKRPGYLYASVRSGKDKSVGIIHSFDSGHGWKVVVDDVGGKSGFISLDISKVDTSVFYGFSNVLQSSHDGGVNWSSATSPPGKVVAISASSVEVATVYAASSKGLYVSRDGGALWAQVQGVKGAATSVQVAADGRIFAFIQGIGLVMTKEPKFHWTVLSNNFDGHDLFNLATDAKDLSSLYASADTGTLVSSRDGGKTWIGFVGSLHAIDDFVEKGKGLYVDMCQECHGVDGVGENPKDIYAKDEQGYVAPPLNDSGHAWHHSNDALFESIRNGSPNNSRMMPWSQRLNFEDTFSVIAYIKSLWSFRSHACQGARHMACMAKK